MAGHVLRCTVYSCDWTLWLGLLAVVSITERLAERTVPIFFPVASMPMLAALLFATCTPYPLGLAYSRYLTFDKPFLTVIAAQLLVFLFVTAVFVVGWGTQAVFASQPCATAVANTVRHFRLALFGGVGTQVV